LAVKDKEGNYLRLNYRVHDMRPDQNPRRDGTIVGLGAPFSIVVEWDDGEEERVRPEHVVHLSKVTAGRQRRG
jgi:hypothetical protein